MKKYISFTFKKIVTMQTNGPILSVNEVMLLVY